MDYWGGGGGGGGAKGYVGGGLPPYLHSPSSYAYANGPNKTQLLAYTETSDNCLLVT